MNTQQALPNVKQTKSELLKSSVLEIARKLLQDKENDIESGIEEGIYSAKDNIETRKFIADAKAVLSEFEKHQPAIYVMLEGGNIQGASATCDIDFNLYDKDNYKAGDLPHDLTPEEWNEQIEALTASNNITGVY